MAHSSAPTVRIMPCFLSETFASDRLEIVAVPVLKQSPTSRLRSNVVHLFAGLPSARRCAGKLLALSLEKVVETPLRKFNSSREPKISGLLHVLNDPAQSQRAAGPTDN